MLRKLWCAGVSEVTLVLCSLLNYIVVLVLVKVFFFFFCEVKVIETVIVAQLLKR